ncbi:MAG TPA: glutathione S-transferase family protein, partial [Rhodospirillales bacterium]|nr:glutathione S-transferase family protein [Rhodospirillales bacterium]
AVPGRYHVYAALICPWASRALLARKLKKLDDTVSVSIVEPFLTDRGWRFGDYPGSDRDPINGADFLHQIYTLADPRHTGRATVPVLWDKVRRTIVNNESADIVRILNTAFNDFGDACLDLYPASLRGLIDALNARLYEGLNNGVYKAGFASSQQAYDEAVAGVFETLDELETRLSDARTYLFGEKINESDLRLFVTLVRFDAAYYDVFKCNLRRLADYPRLTAYVKRIMGLPGAEETVNIDHIKQGYYSIKALNPGGIVPAGPLNSL